ncbi:MAG: hypothetical protein LIO92_02215 [Clostridiales bacterium]|nr:hypothetical protein [Clostridiales bacterium]
MKKSLKALLLAMVLVTMPVSIFAASVSPSESTSSGRDNSSNSGSSSSGGGGGGSSSSSSSSSGSSSVVVAGGPGSSAVSSSINTTDSSSTSTTESGLLETTDAYVTASSGTVYYSGAAYTNPENGIVTALVAEKTSEEKETDNPTTTYVTDRTAKTAGLPDEVKQTISELDNGNISSVSGVDTSGMKTLGSTVAARNEAGGPATIYCSGISADNAGRLKVLRYNNWTGAWDVVDCTVDVENQVVHCNIATSSTLIIVEVNE